MSALTYTFTFSTGQTILASSINSNFTAVANKLNGGLDSDNMGTLTGTFTWSVTSASSLAQSVTTSATEGAAKFTLNGILASGKSGLWITSSANQTTGDALVRIVQSSSSSTIPALSVETSVGEMLGVRKLGTSFRRPYVSKTTTYTATATDGVIEVSSNGANWTLSLPAVASSQGVVLEIVRTDQDHGHIVTVDANGSETINGALTFKLTTQYERLKIYCDGSAWYILQHDAPFTGTATVTLKAVTANPASTGPVQKMRYRRSGKYLVCQIDYRFGSSGFSGGTGDYYFDLSDISSSLSIDVTDIAALSIVGNGLAFDDSASSPIDIHATVDISNNRIKMYRSSAGGYIGPTAPITWAINDYISLMFSVPITNWEA